MIPRAYSPQQVVDLVVRVLFQSDLPPLAAVQFAARLVVFFSSCDARRRGEWEKVTWSEFARADRYPGRLPQASRRAWSEFVEASRAENTSAELSRISYGLSTRIGRGANGPATRVLDAPTNEAFIDPWLGVSADSECNFSTTAS